MAFSYDAGTSTPNLAGLVEFNGTRINDGTFVLTRCELFDGPPLRTVVSAYSSDNGGFAGTPFYDPWDFVLEGYLTVPTLADVWAAKDKLKATFNTDVGLSTLTFNCSGFTDTRTVTAMVSGPIQFLEPDMLDKLVPDRSFTVPMTAVDPLAYDSVARVVTIGTGAAGSLVNNGTIRTPIKVRFNGPLTNPALVSPGGFKIALGPLAGPTNVVIASGHWIEVQTNPAAVGGVTAVDDAGADQYGNVTTFSIHNVSTGTHTWSVTSDAGTGNAVVTTYDAYA